MRLRRYASRTRAISCARSASSTPRRTCRDARSRCCTSSKPSRMAKRDKRSVGLLSLKLDRFRQLREGTDGHAAADEVVRQFAKRITAFVRASDVPARLVGRLVPGRAHGAHHEQRRRGGRGPVAPRARRAIRRGRSCADRPLQHRRRGDATRRGRCGRPARRLARRRRPRAGPRRRSLLRRSEPAAPAHPPA